MGVQQPPPPFPPRRKPGLLHMCTGGDQHRAQEENGIVSGLQDHQQCSVTKEHKAKMTCGEATASPGHRLTIKYRQLVMNRGWGGECNMGVESNCENLRQTCGNIAKKMRGK